MDPSAAAYVSEARLRLSKAPAAELAAAALQAQAEAGIDPSAGNGKGADFIVIAVPAGTAPATLAAALEAARLVDVPDNERRT